ncbi:MAG: nicotinamide mononucleotide transporter [Clostridia bacterium]|nr:nicotinamide mononucleotide transporter [Clostridia bacterium]
MKLHINPLKLFTKFELALWISSLLVVTLSFVLPSEKDWMSLCASLIGVTALIYNAKGNVVGQMLFIAFSLLYGIISLIFGYWGEAITYLCMSLPAATFSTVSWIKHPYGSSGEVRASKMTLKITVYMLILTLPVTTAFYFALSALSTPNLFWSTFSIITSFIASFLAFMRSPYFALVYTLNDIVLIVLWGLACFESIAYLPMVACFFTFLFNDAYGFLSWKRMQKRQLITTDDLQRR